MHANLLEIGRAVMPAAAGVVVATPAGRVLASEPRCADPAALAREAAASAALRTSALVPRAEGIYLVVFAPSPSDPSASSAARALPA